MGYSNAARSPTETSTLAMRVDRIFASRGALAEAMPAFEPRPGQRTMAGAVADVLEAGGTLLAEAGTGTGKTLAYLIPAILSGQRVLVSTGTKNLQEQIFTKDLPLLTGVLPDHFTATCMKGRGNYLCLHRFEQFRQAPTLRSAHDRVYLTLIEEWAATTATGDRAEVDELPDDLGFWPQIAATTENCLGGECPQFAECHVTRMRQRAAESDVVIVNHHLLCADAAVRHQAYGEVIPDFPALIVDEAHQLEDVATQYFGVAISSYRVDELTHDGDRLGQQGAMRGSAHEPGFRAALARARAAAHAFFAILATPGTLAAAAAAELAAPAPEAWDDDRRVRTARREVAAAAGRVRSQTGGPGLFDDRIRVSPAALDVAAVAGLTLIESLDGIESAVTLFKDAGEDVRAIGRRAAVLRDDLRFFMRADDPAFVFFVEVRAAGVFLRALPIDVAGIVRERLFDRHRTNVLTSATLTIAGAFDYVKGRLGIDDADEVVLPSEFDFRAQSVLYLPRRMPEPRDPSFQQRAGDEVIEILRRTEGRAFVLFTSYSAMHAMHQRVTTALPYPILMQGTAPRGVLLEQFKRTANAVLLATSSFWQGVDVVGDALSCVIIDKLPFASPGDPIVAARIEAVTARGGNAFGEYQVPLAILTLLQGLGRLLRHREDRGVLAILDPRLQTMGYGRRFLQSLPPSPITRNPDDITRFFARQPLP